MGTATLRPNGTGITGWSSIGGGAGSAHAAMSDNNDSTYVEASSGDAASLHDLTTSTIPANAQIRSLTPRARMAAASNASGWNNNLGLQLLVDGSNVFNIYGAIGAPTTTITTFTGTAQTSRNDGEPITQLRRAQ